VLSHAGFFLYRPPPFLECSWYGCLSSHPYPIPVFSFVTVPFSCQPPYLPTLSNLCSLIPRPEPFPRLSLGDSYFFCPLRRSPFCFPANVQVGLESGTFLFLTPLCCSFVVSFVSIFRIVRSYLLHLERSLVLTIALSRYSANLHFLSVSSLFPQ